MGGNIEVDGHGGCHLAYGEVDGHHYAEPEGIPAKIGDDGQHERQEDVVNRDGVEQHAREKQDDVDHEHDDNGTAGKGEKERGSLFDETHSGRHPAEEACAGDHDHDDGRGAHGLRKNLEQHFDAVDCLINEDADEKTVENSNGCCLCGRENAAVYAPENDNRRHGSPERFFQDLEHGLSAPDAVVAAFFGNDHDSGENKAGDDQAGDEAACKQGRNRDICDAAVHNKGDARRDDDGDTRGDGDGR